MCGIGGWFGAQAPLDPRALLNALRHRGPDGQGAWISTDGRAGLVHTRLAIVDLTAAGTQPMFRAQSGRSDREDNDFDDGSPRYVIVFNGEIFNYPELRENLVKEGESFSGRSDTEVLLALLVRHGKDALPMLAGMFSFIFYDRANDYVLAARDAFGIKPLYYSEPAGALLFASEVRTMRVMLPELPVSTAAVRDTLMWGAVQEPATIVAGVHELAAGALLERISGRTVVSSWHTIRFPNGQSPCDPVATTRAALEESVRRHLVSDVPVGIFLSGGIDSTAVLALARHALGPTSDLRTFSIGFDDAAFDESATARQTAECFGTRHCEWRMSAKDGQHELSSYLDAVDQPTIDGFNTWCVSKLARREGMKVVLSGLGGDEIFGGYPSFSRLSRLMQLHANLGPLRGAAAHAFELASPGSRWRRLAAFLREPATPLTAFHVQRGIFTENEARQLTAQITGTDPGAAGWLLPGDPRSMRDTASLLELTKYMRNQLLRDADVFSMAHGLELRVPFVDSRLFNAVSKIPAHIRTRRQKQLLVDAVPEIPEWVRTRPKRGFLFPFQRWLQNEFGELLRSADAVSPVPLVTWYRRWALTAVLLQTKTAAA